MPKKTVTSKRAQLTEPTEGKTPAPLHPEYPAFLAALKERVLRARVTAARAVNQELVLLYWDIGRGIVGKQESLGWGDGIVETLARDLQLAFPEMSGFAPRSLWNMRRFFLAYSSPQILPQLVAEFRKSGRDLSPPSATATDAAKTRSLQLGFLRQVVAGIPWGHHLLILDKLSDPAARLYYLRATAQLGWSRNVLLNQIKAGAYERALKEKKTHNFALALPEQLAEQADEMLKSRYNLEFLGLGRAMKERDLEDRLVVRLQQFILELGYLPPLPQSPGRLRLENRRVRTGARGQDGLLSQPAQRKGTRPGRPALHRHHPLRAKR
jgi:hypothetical protein